VPSTTTTRSRSALAARRRQPTQVRTGVVRRTTVKSTPQIRARSQCLTDRRSVSKNAGVGPGIPRGNSSQLRTRRRITCAGGGCGPCLCYRGGGEPRSRSWERSHGVALSGCGVAHGTGTAAKTSDFSGCCCGGWEERGRCACGVWSRGGGPAGGAGGVRSSGQLSGFWTWGRHQQSLSLHSHRSSTGNRTFQRSNAIVEPQVPPAAQRLRDHLRLRVIPPLGALPSARRPGTAPTRARPHRRRHDDRPAARRLRVGMSFIYRPLGSRLRLAMGGTGARGRGAWQQLRTMPTHADSCLLMRKKTLGVTSLADSPAAPVVTCPAEPTFLQVSGVSPVVPAGPARATRSTAEPVRGRAAQGRPIVRYLSRPYRRVSISDRKLARRPTGTPAAR
jgi:hypothetical protein